MRKLFDNKSLTAFLRIVLLIAIAVLLYKFVDNSDRFYAWLNGKLGDIFYALKPFIFGIVIAYIFSPIVDALQKQCHKITLTDRSSFEEKWHHFDRLISLLVVYFALIAAISLVIVYLGPSIATGVIDAAVKAPAVYSSIEAGIMSLSDQSQNSLMIQQIFDALNSTVNEVSKNIIAFANVAIGSAFSIVSQMVVMLFALIVSAYFVYYKDFWVKNSLRTIELIFGQNIKVRYMIILREMNHKFIKFVIGKGLASIILGSLCFLTLAALDCPYVVLIAVLYGILNMIPYVGPLLGELIGALLACTVSLQFGVFVFVILFLLQQFDAFYLSPKLVGDALNMSPVWIIFSVFFFGAIFGPLGMFFGSPLMAVILEIFEKYLRGKEVREGLPHGDIRKEERIGLSFQEMRGKQKRTGREEQENEEKQGKG